MCGSVVAASGFDRLVLELRTECRTRKQLRYVFADVACQSELERGSRVEKLSLIHISEPTRQAEISYAVFCLKKIGRTRPNQGNTVF